MLSPAMSAFPAFHERAQLGSNRPAELGRGIALEAGQGRRGMGAGEGGPGRGEGAAGFEPIARVLEGGAQLEVPDWTVRLAVGRLPEGPDRAGPVAAGESPLAL